MKRLLFILLLAAATAHGQIDNPPTSVNIVDSTATGRAVLTATNAAAAATAIGLGTTNDVTFGSITTANGGGITLSGAEGDASVFIRNDAGDLGLYGDVNIIAHKAIIFTNSNDASLTRANLGLGATNAVQFGALTVGSFTTTTPSTWALDATQTAAATNGVLTLPSNANVIRLTNNNAISSVTNGVLGAFYYLVNQATNAVTISNVGGITIDGAQNLTLSPNESATLIATGPTNVSVANRGDLTDVALGGTANTAPSQTASSASSLMTRELNDFRLFGMLAFYDPRRPDIGTVTLTNGAVNDYYASLGQREMQTGTNPAGAAVFTSGYSVKNSGAQNLNWAGRVVVSWHFRRLVSTTSEVRLQFGRDAFASTHAALTARGVGIRITQTNMFFETHDGTTGFETTNSVALPSNDEIFWVDVQSGVARFYRNHDTLLATVTNNVPFNNDASSSEGGWTVSISNTSTNNSYLTLLQNPGFVLQQ
jgi:hypothetical protein